ncbi:hypothetical protein KI387_042165 [Taxus chinensis]|uniref:Squalene cyclase N-terminal domain-containing protein n=1 Tax=Taxus chinensis TaxID=29808 RepID=A0AA38C4I6_TAXCH|nr:hypothetical protein KI387_042165 [Taxus chinensis]
MSRERLSGHYLRRVDTETEAKEGDFGIEHHLHRGRALAAFNCLIGNRAQRLNSLGCVQEQMGQSSRGQSQASSEIQVLLSQLTQSEKKLLISIMPLAVMHFENNVLVASCAFLLELCGLSASVLRVDVASLRRISSPYQSLGSNEHSSLSRSHDVTLFSSSFEDHVKTSLARALSDEYVDVAPKKKKNPAFQKQLKVNLQDHGFSTMFGTVLNYVTLRLLGQGSDGGDKEAMEKGRVWILDHGSATAIPSWGKMWLLALGVFDWSGNNPLPPEIWLLPYFLSIHPGRMWCHCRMVYLPMSYFYGRRFVGPITKTVMCLRKELYTIDVMKSRAWPLTEFGPSAGRGREVALVGLLLQAPSIL